MDAFLTGLDIFRFAYVDFASAEEKAKAISMSEKNLDGRRSLPKAIAERALPDARAVCGIAFLSQEVADGPHEIELIPNETNE